MAESAAYTRRSHSGSARDTSLASGIASGATSLTAADLSTWTTVDDNGPFRFTLSDGTNEEEVEATTVSGNTITGMTRGVGGTTAQAWDAGATIAHESSVRDFDEANYTAAETVGKITAADRFLVSDGVNSLAEKTAAEVKTLLAVTLDELANVVATGGADGDVLTQQADGTFALETPSSGSSVATAKTTRTAGSVTVNSTAFFTADIDTALDLTVAAVAGDVVELSVSGMWDNEAVVGALNFVTRVSGADVNFITGGSATYGVVAWRGESGVRDAIGGGLLYTVQAGDLAAGNVTFRLRGSTPAAASNKVLAATTALPLVCMAKNYGQ